MTASHLVFSLVATSMLILWFAILHCCGKTEGDSNPFTILGEHAADN